MIKGVKYQGEQDGGAGVARAWRGRGAGYRPFLAWGGVGVARAFPVPPGASSGHCLIAGDLALTAVGTGWRDPGGPLGVRRRRPAAAAGRNG
eukprot:gene9357-biopygen22712